MSTPNSGPRSRWMDWKPKTQISTDTVESEPTKTSKTVSVVSVGAPTVVSSKIAAETDPSKLARATSALNRAGVRILDLERGQAIGIWSDRDGPDIRAAIRTLGEGALPVCYLDGDGIPLRYKVRWVAGDPVPSHVLTAMQSATVEPWRVRDAMLRNDRNTQREKTKCH